jgi:hypothetical protein
VNNLAFYVVFGLIVAWSLAWLWALFRASSDLLYTMIIGGKFNLRDLGYSLLCALLALIPLAVVLIFRDEFQSNIPS